MFSFSKKHSALVKALEPESAPTQKSGWSEFNQNLGSTTNSILNASQGIGDSISNIGEGLNSFKPTITTKIGLDTKTLVPILLVILFIFRKKLF